MSNLTFVDPALIEQAKALRDLNVPWLTVSKRTGISMDKLRRRLDPVWAENRRHEKRMEMVKLRLVRAEHGRPEPGHFHPDEVRKIVAGVPPDTRSPIARFMGDPLPERSALFKRNSQSI